MTFRLNWQLKSSKTTFCQCSKVMKKNTLRKNMTTSRPVPNPNANLAKLDLLQLIKP